LLLTWEKSCSSKSECLRSILNVASNHNFVTLRHSLPTANFDAPNPTHAPARNLPLSFSPSYVEHIESNTGRTISSTASFADPHSPPSCERLPPCASTTVDAVAMTTRRKNERNADGTTKRRGERRGDRERGSPAMVLLLLVILVLYEEENNTLYI
jgi:hypothetical protein